ncbi:phage tail protein [Pedobacter ginsengisoli]|uniref:Phage tail protein n=1 Tax=Pedobacter ginsengisoli TaxID=363852 RepID=A0A2D1U756_9SPHI|nr:tail fiber protein [Pedobacter ginsengisoli]ATP57436.1 phage tail protein [Pedobacter ginsengisoli]
MTDPFIGGIFMFAGNFAMRGTAVCNGQLLPIQQNTALFSILGTTYGGNGQSTFALPNLMGRCPIMPGNNHDLGETGGSPSVTLISTEMPSHNHGVQAAIGTGGAAATANPIGALPGTTTSTPLYSDQAGTGFMSPLTTNFSSQTQPTGGNQPHNNLQPYLVVTFVIAMQGIFPARN